MTPRTTFQIVRMESWVIEKAATSSVGAWLLQRGDVERLGLADAAGRDREEPGEHVRRGDQEDGERGDRDREGGHEDDVHADAAAVGGGRRRATSLA